MARQLRAGVVFDECNRYLPEMVRLQALGYVEVGRDAKLNQIESLLKGVAITQITALPPPSMHHPLMHQEGGSVDSDKKSPPNLNFIFFLHLIFYKRQAK